ENQRRFHESTTTYCADDSAPLLNEPVNAYEIFKRGCRVCLTGWHKNPKEMAASNQRRLRKSGVNYFPLTAFGGVSGPSSMVRCCGSAMS
ncbi:MAG: hypothetical protein L0229_29090, partial [Blastocatellia bacterium]|nr:hypothetical protein [Blastocatellia bacterium]